VAGTRGNCWRDLVAATYCFGEEQVEHFCPVWFCVIANLIPVLPPVFQRLCNDVHTALTSFLVNVEMLFIS